MVPLVEARRDFSYRNAQPEVGLEPSKYTIEASH